MHPIPGGLAILAQSLDQGARGDMSRLVPVRMRGYQLTNQRRRPPPFSRSLLAPTPCIAASFKLEQVRAHVDGLQVWTACTVGRRRHL